jgi:periplasmic divalent cation tolerance protein
MTDVVLIFSTVPADWDAAGLADALVRSGLAACVSVGAPMVSTYRWQSAIEIASERQVVIKTTVDRVAALERELHSRHPYEVPEFLVVPVQGGSGAYLNWVAGR